MILITENDFSVDAVLDEMRKQSIGAIVCFLGIVRADPGVEGLEIEIYEEMANQELGRIEEEAKRLFKINGIRIIHRKGELKAGENILLVVVASSHREEGFQATRFVIEQIKARAPIWKKEKGTGSWVIG